MKPSLIKHLGVWMSIEPTGPLVTVTYMDQRESGRIRFLNGDPQSMQRLQEMGIRPGSHIQLVRHGKPSLVNVDGKKFSLRPEDLDEILVELSIGDPEAVGQASQGHKI